MAHEPVLTEDDFAKSEDCPILGPAYFAGRRLAEQMVGAIDADDMAPVFKEYANKFADVVHEKLMDVALYYFWSDAEHNLQGKFYSAVDEAVLALLGSKPWAINRYVLGERYDCEKVRAEVAAKMPESVLHARIADLEDEVAKLKESLKWARQ